MLCRHTLKAVGTCPNNGLPDRYRISVYTTGVLMCEEVAAAVDALVAVPCYQEAMTQALADRLGCKVKTSCRHLAGGRVATVCVCQPAATQARLAG